MPLLPPLPPPYPPLSYVVVVVPVSFVFVKFSNSELFVSTTSTLPSGVTLQTVFPSSLTQTVSDLFVSASEIETFQYLARPITSGHLFRTSSYNTGAVMLLTSSILREADGNCL